MRASLLAALILPLLNLAAASADPGKPGTTGTGLGFKSPEEQQAWTSSAAQCREPWTIAGAMKTRRERGVSNLDNPIVAARRGYEGEIQARAEIEMTGVHDELGEARHIETHRLRGLYDTPVARKILGQVILSLSPGEQLNVAKFLNLLPGASSIESDAIEFEKQLETIVERVIYGFKPANADRIEGLADLIPARYDLAELGRERTTANLFGMEENDFITLIAEWKKMRDPANRALDLLDARKALFYKLVDPLDGSRYSQRVEEAVYGRRQGRVTRAVRAMGASTARSIAAARKDTQRYLRRVAAGAGIAAALYLAYLGPVHWLVINPIHNAQIMRDLPPSASQLLTGIDSEYSEHEDTVYSYVRAHNKDLDFQTARALAARTRYPGYAVGAILDARARAFTVDQMLEVIGVIQDAPARDELILRLAKLRVRPTAEEFDKLRGASTSAWTRGQLDDMQHWLEANADAEGYGKDGFNFMGLDRKGFDRKGYDRDGFNRQGRNRKGYDRQGNDKDGGHDYEYPRGYPDAESSG